MDISSPISDVPGGTNAQEQTAPSVRAVIQQPVLAQYRVPVFKELSSREAIELQVLYGDSKGIPNSSADGFASELMTLSQFRLLGSELRWHSAQWRAVGNKQFDVAILVWNVRYLSLLPALLRAKITGVKTILWGHAYSKQESRLRSFLRRNFAKLADALMFYSEEAALQYRSIGWPSERLYVAINSLDQKPIQEARQYWVGSSDRMLDFQRRNDLCGGPIILYVSRFDPNNRVDLLIEATAQLAKEFPKLQVILIGPKDSVQQELQKLCERLHVGKYVRFPGAIYSEHDLAPWFLSADVFCYPANIGLSILHAFGYGLPVVTSDDIASHNPEISALKPGINGHFYTHGSCQSLVSSLREILLDRTYLNELGENATRTVQEEFTLSRMVDGIERAIKNVGSKSMRIV